jgi:hypothetical protein
MSLKLRRTFWISANVTALHERRAQLLEKNGFHVSFARNASIAMKLARESRPICIIIDTPPISNQIDTQALMSLAKSPELNGVRFLLSITHESADFRQFAISENFRDVISLSISDEQWVSRILYSNVLEKIKSSAPHFEIGINQIASTVSSGRITWISPTHIRIECRGEYCVGKALHISGAISETMNLPHISLVVESVEKSQLLYRYSQALVCRWQVTPEKKSHSQKIIQQLLIDKPDPKLRAFLAISRPSVRATLAKGLNVERFFVRAGLQKSNLAQEVRYFSPNIIFFDDKLLETVKPSEIDAIKAHISIKTPIVIFAHASEKISPLFSGHKVVFEASIQQVHLQNAESRYDLQKESSGGTWEICTIPPEHPWSKIGIHTPTRLKSISPSAGVLASSVPIGDFSLARLESPFLKRIIGRDPIIKIKSTNQSESESMFTYDSEFHFSDLSNQDQTLIANAIIELLKGNYSKKLDEDFQQTDHELLSINYENESEKITQTSEPNIASRQVVGGQIDGSSALKGTFSSSNRDINVGVSATNNLTKNTLTPATKTSNFKPIYRTASKVKPLFNFDVTVIKAIAISLLFSVLLVFILKYAEKVGSTRENKLGKEYTDFFFRMNPHLKKKSDRPTSE